jgi:hypothetical protein
MLDKLTIDDFKKRVGETFVVTPRNAQGRPVKREAFEVELRRAEPSPYDDGKDKSGEAAKARKRKPFSVEFHSRLPHHLPQQIVAVEHAKMGKFELFLVPLAPDAEGHRYEAVFG